jgi:hypothetical protein
MLSVNQTMPFPVRFVSQKKFLVAPLLTLAVCLPGCKNQPTNAQIDAWHQEAVTRNAQMVATHTNEAQKREWQLLIQGQTSSGKPVKLGWKDLKALATTHVLTPLPFKKVDNTNTSLDFRGVKVSTLLDKFGVAPDVTDVTFVAYDAYWQTLKLADLQNYPIAIALERNGKPIARPDGGPLFLVFPHAQYPETQKKFDERYWVYYVTNMIIGTEPASVRVTIPAKSDRLLDSAALNKLPQVSLETLVAYKIGWPNTKVKLQGVRVRDVLAAAGVQIPAKGFIIVRGKPPVYHDPASPIRLTAESIQNCDILLATRWGNDNQPIPAKIGGPVTLAFPPTCPFLSGKQRWVTFVEDLEVVTP